MAVTSGHNLGPSWWNRRRNRISSIPSRQPKQAMAAAFEMLVQRYQEFAYAVAFAKLGDRQLAQEVAREAFLPLA